jgi:flagellar L-ring protein FlgH
MLPILIAALLIQVQALAISLLDGGGLEHKTNLSNPRSYIEPYKAKGVGDVITIRVTERVGAIKKSEIDLKVNYDSEGDFGYSTNKVTTSTLAPDTNDVANTLTKYTVPLSFNRSKDKNIDVNQKADVDTLVSALIVEIDPESGNMIVEGSRQILIEGETKSLYVRGVLNPKDIDSNNEVPSYKLANAQIQVIGSGALSKDRDGGIIQTIFKFIF